MIVTYLLIAVFIVWSARSIRSLWRAAYGEKLNSRPATRSARRPSRSVSWYLATKIVGWS